MKHYTTLLLLMLLMLAFGCSAEGGEKMHVPDCPTSPIAIIYENDVHCAVDGYAKLVTLREQQRAAGAFVTTVSCGDFAQGDVVGAVSQGELVVDIMNRVQYDVVTPGNHEFDFGMTQLFRLAELLDAPMVSSNFRDLRTGELCFPPYQIVRTGDVDIAYIGFTTTATVTSVSPLTFRDEAGTVIYDFTKEDFYKQAQQRIDEARSAGVDYVVALAHLGDTDGGEHPSSPTLIARTTGIDVVLDGHDHHVIPDTLVNNLAGRPVLLSSTGTKFANVGLLTLSTEGVFTSRLIPAEELTGDASVQALVDDIKDQALADGLRVVGESEVELSIYDENGTRLVRSRETGIGNFCADALRRVQDTDVAMVNGGGVRADLPQGELTFNDLLAVFPFNNAICTAAMTGQQLLDALEYSVSSLPEENGSFMQVSGMKFEVDSSVPSPIVLDGDGLFSHVAEGPRRVSGLQILDKASGAYQPVDASRTYTLSGFDYLLKELGGEGIFRYATLLADNLGQDVDMLAAYISQFLNGRIGREYGQPEGRIVIR